MNTQAVGSPRNFGDRQKLWVLAAVVGGVMQLTVGFFTVTGIGLVSVPLWAAAALVGAWVAAAALLVRTVRRAPLMAVLIPVANGALLWGLMAAGGAWLGWTA